MWDVKVEDHFPDRDKFDISAGFFTAKRNRGGFTQKEFFRLKKILCDIRKDINA